MPIINSAQTSISERLLDADEVHEFAMEVKNQILFHNFFALRIMLVEPALDEQGRERYSGDEPLDICYGILDATMVRSGGFTRMRLNKTIHHNGQIRNEAMELKSTDADVANLITHFINILNSMIPEKPELEQE